MGEGTGVDEGSSFAKRAECLSAFNERDKPSDSGEYNAAHEDIGCEFRRCVEKDNQSGDACDDADIIERAEEDRAEVAPRDRYRAIIPWFRI